MKENKLQEERLDYLLENFLKEKDDYKDIEIPSDIQGKRRLLRSLMNVRMPRIISGDVIKVQDDYLKERAVEKGMVKLSDIPIRVDNLSIWQGDITRLAVDAIVNAANSYMLGCFVHLHSCIDNQIHTYAGIELREECFNNMAKLKEKFGNDYEQETAIPMLTDAYNLPAKKVIHIVGPIVGNSLTEKNKKELEACYRNSLDMCLENNIKSIAFCCISTGVFRFPNKKAAEIAVKTVKKWNKEHPNAMDRIIFNVFKNEDKKYYEDILQ